MEADARPPLAAGDVLSHFTVQTIDGATFAYSSIWQARNLVLVALPPGEAARAYADTLRPHAREFEARNGVLVITTVPPDRLPAARVVIADRWGEIVHMATPSAVAALPSLEDLLDWLDYVEHRCPECEGEAR